mgnify:CR=1 FL=1
MHVHVLLDQDQEGPEPRRTLYNVRGLFLLLRRLPCVLISFLIVFCRLNQGFVRLVAQKIKDWSEMNVVESDTSMFQGGQTLNVPWSRTMSQSYTCVWNVSRTIDDLNHIGWVYACGDVWKSIVVTLLVNIMLQTLKVRGSAMLNIQHSRPWQHETPSSTNYRKGGIVLTQIRSIEAKGNLVWKEPMNLVNGYKSSNFSSNDQNHVTKYPAQTSRWTLPNDHVSFTKW